MEDRIKSFLSLDNGYGSGSGSGSGSGCGSGDGYGIKSVCGQSIYCIDGVQTLLDRVHSNVAKGNILMSDLTLRKCYVVKQGNLFAHGETLHEAQSALMDKLFDDMPEDDRINAFIEVHEAGKKYKNNDFFDWHHKLTGSCEAGRKAFADNHNIDMSGSMTVGEFINLTKDAYGGHIIKKLEAHYSA